MMLIAYSVIFYLLTPLFLIYIFWRSIQNPAYRKNISQRFGFIPHSTNTKKTICIHAVSVGEVNAIAPVIDRLLKEHPDIKLLVTTTTPTGRDQSFKIFGDRLEHYYLPWDLPDAIKRFISRINPVAFIIVETELWPNLYTQLGENNVPLIIVNARLSDKSYHRYLKLKPLVKTMLDQVDIVLAQTKDHAKRFIELGMVPDRIEIMGNLKFDMLPPDDAKHVAQTLKQKCHNKSIWIAASTHKGEEQILLKAFENAKNDIDDLLLLLVPRHPERFQQVYEMASKKFNTVKYSDQTIFPENTEVIIGDVMGNLFSFYASGDLAFIGGSLIQHGGQNPIEAAANGLPMIMGDSRYNFDHVTDELIHAGAMRVANSHEEITQCVHEIMLEKNVRDSMSLASTKTYHANQGAVEHVMTIVSRYI